MRILVTGATGFLGSCLVRQLIDQGIEVRALVRETSQTDALQALNVDTVTGSLVNGHNLDQAVSGVDAVAHCAGGGWARSPEDMYANNAGTTINLLKALEGSSISRFVFVSSLAAHGPSRTGTPRDPNQAPSPITHYGRAKAQAEEHVITYSSHFPVTIIRPPAIYGPGDIRMLPLFKSATRGIVPIPRTGKTTSLIHVSDCAHAISLALMNSHATGRKYFVEDGQIQTFRSMAQLIGQAVNTTPWIIRMPYSIMWTAALISEFVGRFRRRPVLLNRDKVHDLKQPHWVCNANPIRDELGWTPRIPFAEGAAATAHWYQENGWIR